MSAILGTMAYQCYFNQGPIGPPFTDDLTCSGPTASTQGGITAAMPAGSWLGALISGYLSDMFGRKTSIMVGCIIWCIGSTIVCASQNIGMLIAGRVINGLAVGIESAQVPVYISELAPPSKRGRLVGIQQWAITWGILILYYISYGTSFLGGQTPTTYDPAVFRIPWGLQMLPAIFLFGMMFLLPESPRWFARKVGNSSAPAPHFPLLSWLTRDAGSMGGLPRSPDSRPRQRRSQQCLRQDRDGRHP